MLSELDQGRRKRLLIVHAPAGYGKTILLGQWRTFVVKSGARVAWIGLEKIDHSAERFVAGIAASLVHAGVEISADLTNPDSTAGADTSLDKLLTCCERSARETWLIFDDWHRAQSPAICGLLEAMLRRMPVNWHIAIASRGRPKLNLASLRSQGQLIEFDKDNLLFGIEDTQRLMGETLSSSTAIAEIYSATEGWPISLQLGRLWLQNGGSLARLTSSFIESVDGMGDYLATEIFAAISPETWEFLKESSVCERFNAALMDGIRDDDNADRHIEMLHWQHGVIQPFEDGRQWYRHHPIAAEYLHRELRRLPRERTNHLHARAADWFERNSLLFEAVDHARLSGDQARTVELVENADCVDICLNAGASAVRSLLESLPSDTVRQRPRLRAAHTAMNLKLGSIAQAGIALAELQASLNPNHVDAALERDLLVVESLRLCFIDRNPTLEHLAAHRRALENLAAADWCLKGLMHNVQGRIEMRGGQLEDAAASFATAHGFFDAGGSAQGRFLMNANLAICQLFLGQLTVAEPCIQDARLILERKLDGAPTYAAIAHTADALLFYERNELAAASQSSQLGLAGLEQAEGCLEQYLICAHVASRTAFVTSGLDAANEVIERGRRLAQYHGLQLMEGLLDCLFARLLIEAGKWDEAKLLMTKPHELAPLSPVDGWLEIDFVAPVHCLLEMAEGRLGQAKALAAIMIEHCRTGGRIAAAVRAHLITALVCAADEDDAGVREGLANALALATPQALLAPFFEQNASLLLLLQRFQQSDAAELPMDQASFLNRLVLRAVATGKAKDRCDQLTGREREILVLLARGGSNKVIARSLDLTEDGVKFHLKKVFRKLGVEDRTMAAAVGARMPLS